MELCIRTSTEHRATQQGQECWPGATVFCASCQTSLAQKGTMRNTQSSADTGLSHHVHVTQGALSHQRSDVGYLLTAEGFIIPCSSLLLGKLRLNKIFQGKQK